MRAVVSLIRDGGTCTAKTDNELALVFTVTDGTLLSLGDELDVDLGRVFDTQELHRRSDSRRVAIRMSRFDVHDLRLAFPGHGVPSSVSDRRLLSS
jgi:hypothetical protein